MAIGPDIADVLEELGSPYTIHYIDGTIASGEKLDYETYPEHSSEFIRMFFYTVTLPYNTMAAKGNVISFNGTHFLVTNLTPSLFEDSIVDYTAVLFRCNLSGGTIQRFADSPGFDADYKRQQNWSDMYTGVYGLQTEAKFEFELKDFEDILDVPTSKNLLHISGDYQVEIGDRWRISATEFYKVELISFRRLDNMNIISLAADTRV